MTEVLVPVELLTGVGEMDAQHDHLFHEMQKVKNALLAVSGDDEEGLSLLSRLTDDLAQHFAWEEEAARTHGVPFGEHRREHARMLAFVRTKIAEIDRGICNIPALMVFMERKFESHVVHYDLMLGRALRDAAPVRDAAASVVRQRRADAA
ncbi:bacteriohemerythrin [Methyloversatilis sp.]|uniref:bacteriohemerythrin n=1 Tax=Methyloversatilis sp. TaxID=2569862 RepID=UPI0035B4E364